MIVVKKYSNRRLYDTDSSQYITLEELADKIRGGVDARVVDAKSNEDLTQATLAQIIIESRGAGKLLPIPLLTQLIRMGDDALAEFFGRYLTSALELYQGAKSSAQSLAPYNPFATVPFNATNALARLLLGGMSMGGDVAPAPIPPPQRPPPSPPPPAPSEISALRRELDELKQSLKRRRR